MPELQLPRRGGTTSINFNVRIESSTRFRGSDIAARLAPARPMKHALVLGFMGLVLSIVGLAATWNGPDLGPRWYPIALVITTLPCAWLGGRLHVIQLRAR